MTNTLIILTLRSLRTGFAVAGGFVLILLAIDAGGFGSETAASPTGALALLAVFASVGMIFSGIRFALFALESAPTPDMATVAVPSDATKG